MMLVSCLRLGNAWRGDIMISHCFGLNKSLEGAIDTPPERHPGSCEELTTIVCLLSHIIYLIKLVYLIKLCILFMSAWYQIRIIMHIMDIQSALRVFRPMGLKQHNKYLHKSLINDMSERNKTFL